MFTVKRLLIVGATIAITAAAAACSGTAAKSAAPATPATTAAPAAPAVTEAPTTQAPATTAAPAPASWHTVIKASGDAKKRTDLFDLHGGRAKLTYTFTDTAGYGMVVGAIYVLDEGANLEQDGGIPEVMVSKPGTDSTELTPSTGRHYLLVDAANAHWTVTIQELR
jgi:hypothetical protein